jgi:hypothetical protein
MKYHLFILLIVAVLITAGCVGGKQDTPFTSKPTITQIPASTNAQDPIIGVWRWYKPEFYDVRYRFNTDGTFEASFCFNPDQPIRNIDVFKGTWGAQGGNLYIIKWVDLNGTVMTTTRLYDASRNVIYPEGYPDQLYTSYPGDTEAASSRLVVPVATTDIKITKTQAP